MTKEMIKPISSTEIEPMAEGLAQTFIHRWDMYPRQLDDGSYICVKKPLTQKHILAHLRGDITIGAYLLDPDSQARFIVIDADSEDQMDMLMETALSLGEDNIPNYLEQSRRGGHLWFFFEQPISGEDARKFGFGVMAVHNLQGIELYPKQDVLGEGPGSLIRLPFGVHRWDMQSYGFISPDGRSLRPNLLDQIPLFFKPQIVSDGVFTEFWEIGAVGNGKPEFSPSKEVGETLSQSIKGAITVLDFVGQYVELTPAGRGHCPFHNDKRKSFSVNTQKNYWHCFAGCGGGSVIDFWMKHQGSDFKTALGELAGMLLA